MYRPYDPLRQLIASMGGDMTWKPTGVGGEWVLTLHGRTATIPCRNNRVNALDRLYVAKVANPQTWDDYDENPVLIPDVSGNSCTLSFGENPYDEGVRQQSCGGTAQAHARTGIQIACGVPSMGDKKRVTKSGASVVAEHVPNAIGNKESDLKRKTPPNQDEVVKAVLSRASNVQRLVSQFTAAIGDPLEAALEPGVEFPEIASGGLVSPKDLKVIYEVYDDLTPLEGRVSERRMTALAEGAELTSAEKTRITKHLLAAYFEEPVDGALYMIVAVTSSSGRTAYWTEIREGYSFEGIRRKIVGIFPSVTAAKAAVRRKGLVSARDYRPRHR